METIWHTLAVTESGTHKMRLRSEMYKHVAEVLGKKHCEETGMTYLGTYESEEIDAAEYRYRNSAEYMGRFGKDEGASIEESLENGALKSASDTEQTPFQQLFEGYEGGKPEVQEKWTDSAKGKEIW